MDNLILTPVPLDQLVATITASVLQAIKTNQQEQQQEQLLTTAEVAKMFGVTNVTISSWIAKGVLVPYSTGGRNRFKQSEVMQSMKTVRKYKVR